MSAGLRFPASLQVFPTLRRFRSLRPRRLAAIPIGHRGSVPPEMVAACVRHLYHDLGILAFAGCTRDQIRRIGDVLQMSVDSGGPGAMITQLEWVGKTRRKRVSIGEGDIFEAIDVAHAGIVKPQVVIGIAHRAFTEHIEEMVRDAGMDWEKLQLRERHIHVRGIPSPKGIINYTVKGAHRLPVDAFTNLQIDRKFGLLTGELHLYSAGGKAEYCGGARIDYHLHKLDREERTMKPLYAHRELPLDETDDMRHAARNVIRDDMLRELWSLEGEIYGEQADRLVEYGKVGLKGWERGDEEGSRRGRSEGRSDYGSTRGEYNSSNSRRDREFRPRGYTGKLESHDGRPAGGIRSTYRIDDDSVDHDTMEIRHQHKENKGFENKKPWEEETPVQKPVQKPNFALNALEGFKVNRPETNKLRNLENNSNESIAGYEDNTPLKIRDDGDRPYTGEDFADTWKHPGEHLDFDGSSREPRERDLSVREGREKRERKRTTRLPGW